MLLHQRLCNEADDQGGDLGGGAATPTPVDHSQQVELLTKSVGLLAEGLQKMEGNQQSIIETLAAISNQSKGEVKQDLREEFGDDLDLEQLDRKQFAAFILKNVEKAIQGEMNKTIGAVDGKIQDLAARFESKNANEQISKTAETHPDFWEWSGEIKALLGENPTLSVARAYNLAKSENPEKAEKMKTKYEKPAQKKEHSFLGLTPTSSIGTREGAGKMNQKQAAEAAFDEVMGKLDAIHNGDIKLA